MEKVMSVLDFVEAWWLSVYALLESYGVLGRCEKSPIDRPNPSCSLNLRCDEQEADLLVWESGEAELSTSEPDGSVSRQHFDDIRGQADLAAVLSRFVALARQR